MMSQVVGTGSFEEQFVTFSIGKNLVAIKLSEVETIKLIEEIIPIPRAPNHVLGIANIENSIIPIIDLEVLLSMREMEIKSNAIAIIVSIEAAVFGLYTYDLPKVISFENVATEGPKDKKVDFPVEWIQGYSQEEDRSIPILNPEMFWIGLGTAEITGPAIKDAKISQDQVTFISKEASRKAEIKKKEVKKTDIEKAADKKKEVREKAIKAVEKKIEESKSKKVEEEVKPKKEEKKVEKEVKPKKEEKKVEEEVKTKKEEEEIKPKKVEKKTTKKAKKATTKENETEQTEETKKTKKGKAKKATKA